MDLISSDANIQSRLLDLSPSSFTRGKFSDVKYIFEEAKLLFTNFYSSRKVQKFWWLFIHPRFSKFFNWVPFPDLAKYIISQKKTRKCSTIVAESIWQAVHKCPSPHDEEKQHSYNPLIKLAWKKKDTFNNLLTFPILTTLKCAFPISAFFRPIPYDISDTDKNVKKSCLTSDFIEFS